MTQLRALPVWIRPVYFLCSLVAVAAMLILAFATPSLAAEKGTEAGQWHYLGGDAAHTRYTP
ncbi:MAG: hypothetical protein OEY04_13615, partial [Gammaproteobacteria bacterium]|nr:hypothetical protein [Gammaproteobacteria bacterium]